MTISGIDRAPGFSTDRSLLKKRPSFDSRDCGIEIAAGAAELFDIVPTQLSDNEAFLIFFPRKDIANGEWSLFSPHVVLRYQESLANFAHSWGESVSTVTFPPASLFGIAGLGYSQTIKIAGVFTGSEPVITFIGGEPNRGGSGQPLPLHAPKQAPLHQTAASTRHGSAVRHRSRDHVKRGAVRPLRRPLA